MNTSRVFFLSSIVFTDNFFKCIVTNTNKDEIVKAHHEVYCVEETFEFEFLKESIVYDKKLFIVFLEKLNRNNSENYPFLPGFFHKDNFDLILQIIRNVNSLICNVSLNNETCNDIQNENFIVSDNISLFENSNNNNNVKVLEQENSFALADKHVNDNISKINFVPLTRLFELIPKNKHSFIPFFKEILIFNKSFGFISKGFKRVFPEFNINVYENFPKANLAEQMLWYKLDEQYDVSSTIVKIQEFFDCAIKSNKETKHVNIEDLSDSGDYIPDKQNYVKNENFLNPFELEKIEDKFEKIVQEQPLLKNSVKNTWNQETKITDSTKLNLETSRELYVLDFLKSRCHHVEKSKIKSSVLFKKFHDFYKEKYSNGNYEVFENMFSQTTFTKTLKKRGTFISKRHGDAVYWYNILVSEIPPIPDDF